MITSPSRDRSHGRCPVFSFSLLSPALSPSLHSSINSRLCCYTELFCRCGRGYHRFSLMFEWRGWGEEYSAATWNFTTKYHFILQTNWMTTNIWKTNPLGGGNKVITCLVTWQRPNKTGGWLNVCIIMKTEVCTDTAASLIGSCLYTFLPALSVALV